MFFDLIDNPMIIIKDLDKEVDDNKMFNDLDKINWEKLRVPDAPIWIKGLVSEDIALRDESFEDLRDTYIYERPDLAQHVIPYIIRIVTANHVNADIPLLLEFLKSIRICAIGFVSDDLATQESLSIKQNIDNSLDILKEIYMSSNDAEVKDSAQSLIHNIENA